MTPHIFTLLQKWVSVSVIKVKNIRRISIDVIEDEHKRLKAMASLRGQSIKDYVLERTLGNREDDAVALEELEDLLDSRIRAARTGTVRRRTASAISVTHMGCSLALA